MANPNHLQWLLEGVAAWNARRAADDFQPDFREANIRKAFADAGKLDEYRRMDLGGANLGRADLRGANLGLADLGRAFLGGAFLGGADLGGADVTSIVYSGASPNDARAPEYTDLSTAEGLTQEQVDGMKGDSGTRLPPDLTRPAHWPKLDSNSSDSADAASIPPSTILTESPQTQSRLNESLAVTVRRRTRSQIRSALEEAYPEPRDLAQYMVNQLQAEIALLSISRPNSDEAISEQNQRLNVLNESVLAIEALHNALPDAAQALSEDEAVDEIKSKLARLGEVISKTIADLDANTGTGGNVWRLGVITACSTVMATCGVPIVVGAPIAAGVVGANTIRLILTRE